MISSWDKSKIPNREAGGVLSYIDETDMSKQPEFQNWSSTLGEFEAETEITEKQLEQNIQYAEQKEKHIFLNGRELKLPSIIDENGIDLFMLTDEGISIYMALLAPVYYQETTQDLAKWIRYYAYNKRERTERIFKRYEKWQAYIAECFSSYGIPTELAELCIVESACTSNALSSVGALGMWQIMPETGIQYGMTINMIEDDRLDPIKATGVAAKILNDNYRITGDWTLAVASYNCGAGRTNNIKRGSGTSDWLSIKKRFPKETQQYIPSLLAAHYVWSYRDKLGFAN